MDKTMRTRKPASPILLLLGVLAFGLALPGSAMALDPPNWVAALHIAAQEAIGLRWAPVPGATGYKVLRSSTAGAGHKEIATTAVPQHFDKGITPGETYYYVLQSVAAAEVSAPSAERSVAIPGAKKQQAQVAPELNNPVVSQVVEFGKVISKVGLSWAKAPGAIAYNLMRSTTPGKDYKMITSVSETNFIDVDVQVGNTYYYTVSALDQGFQESPQGAEKSAQIKEPDVKEQVKKVRKEKIKIVLRATRPAFVIKEGDWGALAQPTAVDLAANGDIYISDGAKKTIYVFKSTGEFLFKFGQDDKLMTPQDVTISDEGDVLVVQQSSELVLYNNEGKLKKLVDLEKILTDFPEGGRIVNRAQAGSGGRWYLTSGGQRKIIVLDEDFKLLEKIGSDADGDGLDVLRAPAGTFENRKAGTLLVADTFNFMLKTFKDGKPIGGFGSYGNSVGQFGRLVDVTITGKGELLLADYLNANIQAFDAEGKFLYVLGNETLDEQLTVGTPTSIVERDGRVYITEKLGGKLTVLQLLDEIGLPKKGNK